MYGRHFDRISNVSRGLVVRKISTILLGILGLVICPLSFSTWEIIGENFEFTDRIDTSRLRQKDGIYQVWLLREFFSQKSNADGSVYRSEKLLMHIDCHEEKFAIAAITQYSKTAGAGEVVKNFHRGESEIKWTYIPPQSAAEHLWKTLCR